ncbi:hypothetical protein RB200_33950 [Streptomyces sp. PmtG]
MTHRDRESDELGASSSSAARLVSPSRLCPTTSAIRAVRALAGVDEGPAPAPPRVLAGLGADEARARARAHIAGYPHGAPYRASWRRFGFDDADFADGGSDRLVDALVAIGEDAIARRVDAYWAAGADHVCLQALPADPRTLPLDQWRALAPLAQC